MGEAKGEGESISGRLRAEYGAGRLAPSYTPEITTRVETKSQTLNGPNHPGAPFRVLFNLQSQLIHFFHTFFDFFLNQKMIQPHISSSSQGL